MKKLVWLKAKCRSNGCLVLLLMITHCAVCCLGGASKCCWSCSICKSHRAAMSSTVPLPEHQLSSCLHTARLNSLPQLLLSAIAVCLCKPKCFFPRYWYKGIWIGAQWLKGEFWVVLSTTAPFKPAMCPCCVRKDGVGECRDIKSFPILLLDCQAVV